MITRLLSKLWNGIKWIFRGPERRAIDKAVKSVIVSLPFTPRKGFKVSPGYYQYLGMLQRAADAVWEKLADERQKRKTVRLGKMLRILPGGRHAMFESNFGIIRKPLTA